MAAPTDPILEAVRAADHDRYLTLLYAPAEKRAALAALYAFNAEIATLRYRVRDALPGEVRLQWWRDALAGATANEATGHPVADALIGVIHRHGLPRQAFENYLEARIFDLYNDPMPSRTDLEGYCGETYGAIIQFAALILDAKSAPQVASLAGHAGCAQAITAMLRALPLHRARGQCFIPTEILAAAGTTSDEFVSAKATDSARRAIGAMIALATDHLRAFEAEAKTIPAQLRAAFLPMAPTSAQLAQLAAGKNLLAGTTDLSPLRKQWLILHRAWRGWA